MGNLLGCKAAGEGERGHDGARGPGGLGGVLLPREHHGAVQCCGFWGRGAVVTGGDDGLVAMTELRRSHADPAKAIRVFRGHKKAVTSIHINKKTGVAYSASRDLTLKSWKASNSAAVGNFMGHSLTVMAVGCDRDGLMVASGGRDYAVKLWDPNTCQCTSTSKISRNLVTCLKFWEDGSQKFCQGSEDLTMRVWDVRNISNQSTHAGCR
jgi:WD40 repeat protein